MDNALTKIINENLKMLNLPEFCELDSKQQKRLVSVQTLSTSLQERNLDLLQQVKQNKLTKSTIAKQLKVARKTLYNDQIFNSYIDHLVVNQKDYFNEKKVKELKQENMRMEFNLKKIFDHLIDTQELKKQVSNMEEEINRLVEVTQRQQNIILEKNQIIAGINKEKYKNVINLSTDTS